MFSPESIVGRQIDQFRLDQFIAKGDTCIVYKAFDTVLVRTVALKLISREGEEGASREDTIKREEARKRLIQEAKAAGRLSHFNIVTIHSYGQTQEFEYICMEYVSGKTLTQILEERKVLRVDEAVRVCQQALMALEVAHGAHIVHRDIKPGNIMVTDDGMVKIMDFGIAKLPSFSMTTKGIVLGTPHYMSPEQITGQEVDTRSDIFSLGAVLYQTLTGERPFEAANTATLAYKIVQVEPIPPDVVNIHIPLSLGNIVRKALAKNPGDRFQNPSEMLRAIRAARLEAAPDQIAEPPAAEMPGGGPVSQEAAAVSGSAGGSDGLDTAPTGELRLRQAAFDPVFPESRVSGPTPVDMGGPDAFREGGVVRETPGGAAAQEGMEGDFGDSGKAGVAQALVPGGRFDADADSEDERLSSIPLPVSGERHQSRAYFSRHPGWLVSVLLLAGIGAYAGIMLFGNSMNETREVSQGTTSSSPASSTVGATGALLETAAKQADSMVEDARARLENDPAAAQTLLEAVIARDPRHFEAHNLLGKLLISKKDFQRAIEVYQDGIRINGRSADAYFSMGYAYMAIGDHDSAISSYESCLALKPPYQDEVLSNLAIGYLKKDQPDKAQDLFRQVLDLNPENPVARNYLENAGAMPATLQTQLQPLQPKPREPSIPGPAQAAVGGRGDMATPPPVKGSVDSLVNQAKLQFDTNAENAQKLLEEAIAQDPGHFEAVFQLGRLLTFRKDYRRAIEQYRKALTINNRAPDVFFNLGYIHMSLKDYDSAIVNYEACRALSPPYQDEVLTNLGISRLKKNNLQDAQALFTQATDLNPKNTIARNYLKNLERTHRGMVSSGPADAGQGKPAAVSRQQGAGDASDSLQLEGKYSVSGMSSSGSPYNGTASIGKRGNSFIMTWNIGGKVFSGDGTLSGDRLTVDWKSDEGARGVVGYTVKPGGILQGVWADGRGSETLTRLR